MNAPSQIESALARVGEYLQQSFRQPLVDFDAITGASGFGGRVAVVDELFIEGQGFHARFFMPGDDCTPEDARRITGMVIADRKRGGEGKVFRDGVRIIPPLTPSHDATPEEMADRAIIVFEAFERSGLDLAECTGCGRVIIVVPDGMPAACASCAEP